MLGTLVDDDEDEGRTDERKAFDNSRALISSVSWDEFKQSGCLAVQIQVESFIGNEIGG